VPCHVVGCSFLSTIMPHHHRSGDYGLKLASVPFVPIVNDVPTMDRLTNRDLDRLIVHEPDPEDNKPFSHVLTVIFDTFTSKVPAADELKVSLHKISHRNHRINQNFANTGSDESVPLYDTVARCWNWALPTGHAEKSPDKSVQQGEGASANEAIVASFLRAWTAAFISQFVSQFISFTTTCTNKCDKPPSSVTNQIGYSAWPRAAHCQNLCARCRQQ
jgi:hypothetical protein